MKKLYLIAIALISFSVSYSSGQTFIAGQDFDTENSWTFTEDPATYIEGGEKDIWAAVESLSSNNSLDTPVAGTKFWGIRDLDNDWVDSMPPGPNLTNPYDHTLSFDNVSVSGKTEVAISFYYNAYSIDDTGHLKVEVFLDDVSQGIETVFSYLDGRATDNWAKYSKAVPDGTGNVRITIFAYNNQDYFAVDDVKLEFGAAPPDCPLVFGNKSAECDSATDATDTYTAMLPFTGGGTETYTIVASSGTVSGDDPTSTASGTITVSGIEEGTDLTVSITGGTCDIETVVTSPTCIPAQALPFTDVFDYTAGSALSESAFWNSDGTGDEILVSTGNLSYPALVASSGNSVSYDGDGNESIIKFTPTTSGIVYVSFVFKVTDMTGFTKGGYFAVMGDYKARLYIKPEGSQFFIGMGQTNKIDETKFGMEKYDLNKEIFLVMSYDLMTRYADVWINPAGTDFEAASAPASDVTMPNGTALEMAQLILRQDSPEETPFIILDELRIGLSWAEVTPKSPNASIGNIQTGMAVYPNPVTEGFFKLQSSGKGSLKVFDVLGKQVYSRVGNLNETHDVRHLNPGLYLIHLEQAGETTINKIIVK